MYYLQYLGSILSPVKFTKCSRCSQCSPKPTGWDSWIQASGLNKQMERISAHRLYYVIVKLVCKTHRGVTWREFQKHSQKSLKMVKIPCKLTVKGANFIKRLRI